MVRPPLSAGAVNGTDAVVPESVTVPIVGAPGTTPATAAVAFELADTVPAALDAVTTHRIALPTSSLTKVYVLDVAPLIFEPALCH
jgi:hypothetical protein